jgi:hypothetical protein
MKIGNPRSIALLAFCTLIVQGLVAQGGSGGRQKLKEDSFDPASFAAIEVEMGEVKRKQVLASQFVHCTFVDARPDTAKVGFARFGSYQKFHRLVLPFGCATYLAQNHRPFFAPVPQANDSLVLVLHRFWLSERYFKEDPKVTRSYCHIVADCYKRQNGLLQPLGLLTVFEKEGWIVHHYRALLRDAVVTLLAKADTALRKQEPIGAAIPWDSLQQQIAAKFKQPILTASRAAKGLFLTYTDFINNRPTQVDFEIDEGKHRDDIVAPTLDTSLTNRAWGYNDGSHHYIRLANQFRKLTPVGNAFEIAGPRSFKSNGLRRDGAFVTEVIVGTVDLNTNGFFLQIDPVQVFGGLVLSLLTAANNFARTNELVPLQFDVSTGTLY